MTTGLPAARPSRRHRPVLDWLPGYQPAWLRSDVVAGLTVWALIVPQAIAYAQIAGLPPQAGLFATAAGLIGYALLGTSRQLVVGPTSSTAAISASFVGVLAVGDPQRFGDLSAALALVCGIVLAVFGLARIGFVARFIPAAVRVGFLFGLGLTIMVGQVAKILGVPGSSGSFVDQVRALLGVVPEANGWSVAVGVIALAALLVLRRAVPRVPAALVVVVGGILAVALFDLADRGVAVLGSIDGGFPVPRLPNLHPGDLLALVPGAVAIAIVATAEGLTVAQGIADRHRTEIRPDQEFIATGGANVMAGLFGGFIVGGGASQTAANDAAGGRTQLVSVILAVLTVVTCVALLPLFRDLPQAVLGAIVISAVVGFLRVPELVRIRSLRTDSFVLAIVALVATLALGILPGLITSVLLALLAVLIRLARPGVVPLGREPDRTTWVALARNPASRPVPGTLVLRIEAPLTFLNAGLVRDAVVAEVDGADPAPSVVILDVEATSEIDIESLDTIERLAERLSGSGVELRLAEVHAPVRALIERARSSGAGALPIACRTVEEAIAVAGRRTGDQPNDGGAGDYDGDGR